MFGRVTEPTLAQGFGRLKSHVAGVYTHGKHFASMLDNAVQVGRRAYGVLRPLLEGSATGKRVTGGVRSLTLQQIGSDGFSAMANVWIIGSRLGGRLEATMVPFWFMMQIAMVCGFVTAYPVNWWLIRVGIKEAM